MASNMGFKLNYLLSGPESSASGSNTIALPYHQQTNLADAKDLIDDINAAAGDIAVVQVVRFLKATDTRESYGGTSGTAFQLVAGEGYSVQVAHDVNYIVVGSHAPTLGVVLDGPATSASGNNNFAYPYHATAANAKDLIDDINAAAGSNVVVQVVRFLKGTDTRESYGGTSGTAFQLFAGQAYTVQVSAAVTYIPSHY